jgi:chemotaxis protein MotA
MDMMVFIGTVGFLTVFGLAMSGDGSSTYFQVHSLILVIGGTLSAFFISNPLSVSKEMWLALKRALGRENPFSELEETFVKLSKSRRLAQPVSEPMIQYAVDLWEQGVSADLFIVLLSQKRRNIEQQSQDCIQSLRNLAKYPPALGMAGTVIGMINLFGHLDQNKSSIGIHLSMAMSATFIGILLTNVLIGPLADRLHVLHIQKQNHCSMIYEILLLINRGEPQSFISDEVKSRVA